MGDIVQWEGPALYRLIHPQSEQTNLPTRLLCPRPCHLSTLRSPNNNMNNAASTKVDYRKALLSTEESRAAEKALILKELEAKNILHKLPRGISALQNKQHKC
jgi:hypothetical protein